ncbi:MULTISPECIES: hypothetical protein [Micrococcaceae]|uniref:hypothetical protein n=1 Tax=Micrococcaceae TaxID=1268 RepID=UPI003B428A5D
MDRPLQGGAKKNPNIQHGNSPRQQRHAFGQREELGAPAVFRDAAPSQAVASSGASPFRGSVPCGAGARQPNSQTEGKQHKQDGEQNCPGADGVGIAIPDRGQDERRQDVEAVESR